MKEMIDSKNMTKKLFLHLLFDLVSVSISVEKRFLS